MKKQSLSNPELIFENFFRINTFEISYIENIEIISVTEKQIVYIELNICISKKNHAKEYSFYIFKSNNPLGFHS